MRMTAAVMYEQGLPAPYVESHPFRIEDVDLDGPGPGEVLVEVRSAGLCHSDLSVIQGLRPRKLPMVGGHEAAGIVREVGPGVEGFQQDDHVVMTLVAGCGCCRLCGRGRPALCESVTEPRVKGILATNQRRLSRQSHPIYHHSGISGFAQYAVAVPGSLIKIDPTVPLEDAAMFGCAVVTGAGAVFNSADVKPGEVVAVIGLGGVGLNAVMAARIAQASIIIGIDLQPLKFPLALELGCTHVFDASDPEIAAKIADLTRGGVDYSFEMSGARRAASLAEAITVKGGEIVAVGLGPAKELFEYKHDAMVVNERVMRGSLMGSCIPSRDIPLYLSYYQNGSMPVQKLRSGNIGFDGLNQSFDQLERGEVVRQILMPHEVLA